MKNIARHSSSSNPKKGERRSEIRVSPFCHETPDNHKEVRGWVLDVPSNAPASDLPIPSNLFDGVSLVLCDTSEQEILALMQDAEKTRARLAEAVNEVMMLASLSSDDNTYDAAVAATTSNHHTSKKNKSKKSKPLKFLQRASWTRCRPSINNGGIPSSLLAAFRDKEGHIVFKPDGGSCCSNNIYSGGGGGGAVGPIIDSAAWAPELSPDGFVGFFFRWHEGVKENKLCLYAACQSYLPLACLEFADMVHKLEDACTADCVCLSEEAQWLRSACARNRARIIAEVCARMKINVPTVDDYSSTNPAQTPIALISTETLHHDLFYLASATPSFSGEKSSETGTATNSKVRLMNFCSETRSAHNGSICVMAPWDGLWVFKGLTTSSEGILFLNIYND